jgi:arginine exporter protein ArgO
MQNPFSRACSYKHLAPSTYLVSALIFALGVFLGSALWWLLLSSGVSFFKHRINRKFLTIINRLSGVIILMFAAMSLYGLFLN